MRRTARVLVLAAFAALLTTVPGRASGTCDGTTPVDPVNRLARLTQEPPGTQKTYCLFFGPYTIPPGHDLSRVDTDFTMADGFIVGGGPSATNADGSEPSTHDIHIHHAHWWVLDSSRPNYGPSIPVPGMRWIAGSGEEETNGDFRLVAAADPGSNVRYGIAMHSGDRVVLINMVHNKTAQPIAIWIKVWLEFVHGTASSIRDATGLDYHALTPVLDGGSFDVPRGAGHGGVYTYPFDLTGSPSNGVVPGVGRVWTVPFSGTIVIGAAHLHPGALRAVFTNLGQDGDRCPNDRTDGIPGTTLYNLDVINRTAPLSEDFQIEITQPGFRADVRAGDQLSLNGEYESAQHAWWGAMTHTGFYVDEHPVLIRSCAPRIVGTPPGWSPPLPASYSNPWDGVPNRPWSGSPLPVCGAAYGRACDDNRPLEPAGVQTDLITISGFQYTPGGAGLTGPLGPPLVSRGTQLRFLNTDFFAADIRHTVTSCAMPCDGLYVANYPLPDGAFDSGYLGWEPTTGGGGPYYSLDTTPLTPGRYAVFCRIHPWMRGSFEIV